MRRQIFIDLEFAMENSIPFNVISNIFWHSFSNFKSSKFVSVSSFSSIQKNPEKLGTKYLQVVSLTKKVNR